MSLYIDVKKIDKQSGLVVDLSIEKKKWGSSTAYEVVLATESSDRSLAEHDGPPR